MVVVTDADLSQTAATVRGSSGPVETLSAPHRRVGRYLVLEQVGVGAMGQVLRAYDPKLRREVAVKMVRLADPARQRDAVLQEAQAMAKISHPNIVAVFDADVVDEQPFLVMEYVEGGTLGEWLEGDTPSEPQILDAFRQAGLGLQAAHAAGLVHRDFKPANVLRRATGRIQVTDFGIAVEGPVSGVSDGTPAYMAPEQHDGGIADARSDQYAFCVALWEALAGQRPFAGPTLPEAKRTLTLDDAPDARPLSRPLRAVLLRGLAPEPADRFPSMQALGSALQSTRGGRRTAALGLGVAGIAVAGVLGWTWTQQREVRAACEEEGSALVSTWNDSAREQLRAGFEATGAHNATTLHARTIPWIDAFSEQWQTERTRHCLARAESPQPTDPAAQACFDELRVRFDATVDALTTPEPRLAQRAVKIAAGIGQPPECNDEASLRARAPVPTDPGLRAAVADLQADRARLSAAVSAGRAADGVARGQDILERAQEIGWAPQIIDALVVLAERQEAAGDYKAARATAINAFQRALAESYDLAALSASARLVYVVGYGLSDHEEGVEWAETGRSVAHRLGFTEDHPRMSALLSNTAVLHWARGDFEASKLANERSLALKREMFGPKHPSLAGSLENYGITLASMGDMDGAQAAFESALELAIAAMGADHPNVASAIIKLGSVAAGRGATDEARAYFERALPLIEQAYGAEHSDVALILANLANVAQVEEKHAEALAYVTRAEAIVGTPDPPHPYQSSIAVARAKSEFALGDLEAATQTLQTASDLLSALPPEHHERREVDLISAHVRFAAAQRDGDAQDAKKVLGSLDLEDDTLELRTQIKAWLATNGD